MVNWRCIEQDCYTRGFRDCPLVHLVHLFVVGLTDEGRVVQTLTYDLEQAFYPSELVLDFYPGWFWIGIV